VSGSVRVIDLETAGQGLAEVCEIGWQDVAQGPDGFWSLTDVCGSAFVNPGRAITPDTMAVHHILDDWVRGAPYWADIAPEILRSRSGARTLAAHRAAFEQRFCTPKLTGEADWICTWKCAMRLWPELPRFSNQMLRYLRRPSGLIHERGLPAHRALPDAYVTAHHLRDMLNLVSVETLIAWSREAGLLPRVPTGPWRGRDWGELQTEDLLVLGAERDADIRFSARRELERRGVCGAPEQPTPPLQGRLL